MHKLRTLLLSLAAICCVSGCSDDEAGPTGPCVDYSAIDTNACNGGPCSYANDVIPIFRLSCSVGTSCHNTADSSPEEGLALAPSLQDPDPAQADLDATHAAIVGGTSVRSSFSLVRAGDPAASWLMAKMEYLDFTSCSAVHDSCSSTTDGCGVLMPQTSTEPIEIERLNIVRAWIASGAPNN